MFKKIDLTMIEKIAKQLMENRKDNIFPILRARARKRYIEQEYPTFKEHSEAIIRRYLHLKKLEENNKN